MILETIVGQQDRRYNEKGKSLHRPTVRSILKQDGRSAIRKIHRHTLVHRHQIFRDTKDVIPASVFA